MLLLVLILVLIAFGLLVVALLSGSVLWAWVSVGVSVVAAAVLLVDWLQRRSAVRSAAGPEVADATFGRAHPGPAEDARRSSARVADVEPVTEVLPIIPPSGPVPGAAEATAPAAGGGTTAEDSDNRFDHSADAQQTIVMPVVQPSGSSVRPSGAEAESTSSGATSSQTVTKSGGDRTTSQPDQGDERVAAGAADKADKADKAASKEPSVAQASSVTQTPSPEGVTVATALPARAGREPGRAQDGAPAEQSARGSRDAAAPDAEATVLVDARKNGEDGGVVDAAPGSAEQADGRALPDRAQNDRAKQNDRTAQNDRAAHDERTRPADKSSGAVPAEPAGLAGIGAPDAERSGVERSSAEPVPDDNGAEPPEEPRDAVAAALVAGLDDEVVVVDEQPRYHVTGCRALAATAVIPLPAREAVELGFTPCGWCSPDRTLAGRHPAAARP